MELWEIKFIVVEGVLKATAQESKPQDPTIRLEANLERLPAAKIILHHPNRPVHPPLHPKIAAALSAHHNKAAHQQRKRLIKHSLALQTVQTYRL